MKQLIGITFSFVAMTFAAGFHNGTGFFVNSEYIVTAYHVVNDYDYNCYYDIQNDSCYKVHIVDYDAETDFVLLKLDDEPAEMPMVCSLEHAELPNGERLTLYGYTQPFVDPNFTRDGRIGGMNKSVSLMEQNTSNLVKSTEVVRLLRMNGVREYPNTRNVKKCVISIVNSIKEFKSAYGEWGV